MKSVPRWHRFAVLALAVSLVLVLRGIADVRLPAVFTDNAVLQRDMAVPIWGWADEGEQVTVTLDKQTKTATPDASGKWMVKLDAMKAGGPYTFPLPARTRLRLKHHGRRGLALLRAIEHAVSGGSANNAQQEIAAAKFPKSG